MTGNLLGLLCFSTTIAEATGLAAADRDSLASQTREAQLHFGLSEARCTTRDAHFFKGKRELGFLSPQNFRLRR